MIPGQLSDGPRAGRWMDPHNARPAYHYIMLGALAQLAAVLPAGHMERPAVLNALTLGLESRNAEMVGRGVMTKDKAAEALPLVVSVFADDPDFLAKTHTIEALRTLDRLAAAQARGGRQPLGPRGWGLLLERAASP